MILFSNNNWLDLVSGLVE